MRFVDSLRGATGGVACGKYRGCRRPHSGDIPQKPVEAALLRPHISLRPPAPCDSAPAVFRTAVQRVRRAGARPGRLDPQALMSPEHDDAATS